MDHQIRLQLLSFFLRTMGFIFDFITILIASSNIVLRPCWVRALHSMYLHWNSSSMIFWAVSFIMGASFGSFFSIAYSSRKSILFPTKILGTFPTFSCNSGYHYAWNQSYFLAGIDKGRWLHNWKNNEKHIAMGVSERPKAIILFLTSSVPE